MIVHWDTCQVEVFPLVFFAFHTVRNMVRVDMRAIGDIANDGMFRVALYVGHRCGVSDRDVSGCDAGHFLGVWGEDPHR